MSIQYFYNFCLREVDRTDLSGDLLSGVRRSYFDGFRKIRDKLTGSSDDQPYFYDFSIEKEKPMKWTVKDPSGKVIQDVMQSDNGKYYIYFYENQKLYKRLLFSKHHTLLKIEYFDAITGVARHSLEPRKSQNGLCILYTVKSSAVPIPLFSEPDIDDPTIRRRMKKEFSDYTVIASTNEGLVRFLSEVQLAHFRSFKEICEKQAASYREESFVGDDTPLLDKIRAKDFNVKRNLSSSLDITRAMEFGVNDVSGESPEESVAIPVFDASVLAADDLPTIEEPAIAAEEPEVEPVSETVPEIEADIPAVSEESADNSSEAVTELVEEAACEDEKVSAQPDEVQSDADEPEPDEQQSAEQEQAERESEIPQEDEKPAGEPDKRIIADGAVYSYYGDLDERGNRSGFGRTMTELGRTAYEGNYLNDKRSGNGSYFYKNGALCYSGDWLENARHGVGVGVSSRDGSIHVGNWKNNKPEGSGVRLTAEGDIRFVCRELSDGTTVLMNYLPDDTVVISKYDKNGMKLGDTTLSLKDLPL